MNLNWQNILAVAVVLVVFASMVTMETFSYTDKTYDKIEELHRQLLLKISDLRVLLVSKRYGISEDDKPATIVPEDMCEDEKEEHPLEDCVLYLYMREKQREEEEKKQENYWKVVTTDTSMPPMTVHLNAGRNANGDVIMDIFRNSGMDVRPNSCPNCTHEI